MRLSFADIGVIHTRPHILAFVRDRYSSPLRHELRPGAGGPAFGATTIYCLKLKVLNEKMGTAKKQGSVA